MSDTFYVGTPIYYTNGIPHIGHSYTSVIADVFARYNRLKGKKVKFVTGVDENSQKVVQKAEEMGMSVEAFTDMMAEKHKAVWDGMDISYTDFLRTTEDRHRKTVQRMLQRSFDKGDIYEGVYEGLYCVGCEGFKKESDLIDGKCPDHPNLEVSHLKEKNYFFRLSKYQKALEELYADRPDFVLPASRFREVQEFVRQGLEDFSVSRQTSTVGIPLPFDPSQVTYVWYDALFFYLTSCGDETNEFWPINLHCLGKDILRFHAIYWPAMLMSAGIPLPEHILANGFFTVDGQKISKTIGNVIDPVEFIAETSRDTLVLYLLSAFPVGGDGDFSREQAIALYNAKLANNIGNLMNRFAVLGYKAGGNIAAQSNNETIQTVAAKIRQGFAHLDAFDLKAALEEAFEVSDILNKYVDATKPWELLKENTQENTAKLQTILGTLGEGVRLLGLLLLPFFSDRVEGFFASVGLGSTYNRDTIATSGGIDTYITKQETFAPNGEGYIVFPRLEAK